jgi:hypothetical protein
VLQQSLSIVEPIIRIGRQQFHLIEAVLQSEHILERSTDVIDFELSFLLTFVLLAFEDDSAVWKVVKDVFFLLLHLYLEFLLKHRYGLLLFKQQEC